MEDRADHRDTLYTIDKRGRRKWVYAHFLPGFLFRRRAIVAYVLMIFYLLMPWIQIGGKQGVLIDIPHRRFIFFGLELWATDTIFLFLALGILGMSLFFFTSILGRVWCGWACPETVFLEFLFRPIERWIEGSESERRKLDAAPWSVRKIMKKSLKHAACAGGAWVLASTALAYFIGREPLIEMMSHSPLSNLGPFCMTVALMGVMAFQFGWFREQFCTLVCPYARFQSVLMDQNSLLVGYDKNRGEPRGKLHRSDLNKGDCIDCGLCVRVCPTGIDIRNGTQLECIACSACVDACDSVMRKIEKPEGLIRYSTEANLRHVPSNWVRPRIFAYATILAILLSALVVKLTSRQVFDSEIVRVAQITPFSVDDVGTVTNQFSLRLANKGRAPQRFELVSISPEGIQLISPVAQIELLPEEMQQIPLFVRAPLNRFSRGRLKVNLKIQSSHGESTNREIMLIGPEHL